MSIPFRFDDDNTERAQASGLLSWGITQAVRAAALVANRAAAAKAISDSVNGSALGSQPAAFFGNNLVVAAAPNPVQANTQNPQDNPAAVVPPPGGDPLRVTATSPYQQPNTSNPAPRAPGITSAKNP